jgi:protein-L-isoaspartate(D-aspartate) O-methyltransferase
MRWLALIGVVFLFFQKDGYERARHKMVKEQLEARGISNSKVLAAMRTVPRHKLVRQNMMKHAYLDRPLSIGSGQTISQPYIVAFMTEAINPHQDMKVLEIGTGSGYQAAVLAEIVDLVFTIEIHEALGRKAQRDLQALGYENIHVRVGDGYAGWPEEAPFDAIVVTAAPDDIPEPLIEQLAEGGKMVIPVGPVGQVQELLLIEKRDGRLKRDHLAPVRFVPFTRDTL